MRQTYRHLASSRLSRRALLRSTALFTGVLAGGAAWGCGGGNEEGAALRATPGGQPIRGGAFHHSVSQLGELDPHTTTSPFSSGVTHLVNNHIVRLNARTLLPESDLAQSWEFPDSTTALFRFHPDVRWQNRAPVNGRPFVAADAAFSIDRSRTPKPEFLRRTSYEPVDVVEAVDDQTLRIRTRSPYAPLLAVLGDQFEVVVAPEVVAQFGDLKRSDSMIGTGAYELQRYDMDVGFLLRRRADAYFKSDAAWLDEIETTVIPEQQAVNAALRSGKLDAGGVDELDQESAQRANPNMDIYRSLLLSRELLILNLTRDPFQDTRIQQAVNRAIDRDQIVNVAWNGNGSATGPVSPGLSGWALPEDELRSLPGYLKPKDEDLAEAKSLLSAAGFGDGFDSTISTTESFGFGKVAQVIQAQLKKVGINANIEIVEFGALVKRITEGDYRMVVISGLAGADPDQQLYPFYHTGGGYNNTGYSVPDTDRLLEQQRAETDVDRRKEMIVDLQRRLIEQPGGNMWLTCRGALVATYPYVRNFVPVSGSIFAFYNLENVWLDKA